MALGFWHCLLCNVCIPKASQCSHCRTWGPGGILPWHSGVNFKLQLRNILALPTCGLKAHVHTEVCETPVCAYVSTIASILLTFLLAPS